ncbi:MAG: cupin domain-containing protein [Gemmatimonadaceae bacterium]|nr:cupin domain-containing protein [Gemmatimonadaceae bacterium]NUT05972.1 cupin domain-containing protein [Hamadaea sp.]
MSLDVHAASLAGGVLAPPGSNIVLAEWTAEAATGPEPLYQAPLHKHEDDEAWYVLSGVLRIRVGEDEVEVPAGGAAVVPGGTPHTYWNPGSEPARYLLVMGARTYELIQAIHSPDRGDLRDLFTKYGAELLDY